MYFVGIDVGQKGALAVLNVHGSVVDTFLLPHKKIVLTESTKRVTSLLDVSEIKSRVFPILTGKELIVTMEQIFVMHKAGINSAITAGINYGRLWATIENICEYINIVNANKWQKSKIMRNLMKELPKPSSSSDTKSTSIALATHLFGGDVLIPKGKKVPQDGISDALLLAEYTRREWMGGTCL